MNERVLRVVAPLVVLASTGKNATIQAQASTAACCGR